ncbi:MAG TPA: alkaline phosphatase family protein [Candidatus Binatia bacterium]|jgi:acid phosphatase
MMRSLIAIAAILFLPIALAHGAEPRYSSAPRFGKVMIVVLENANYRDALAQPFLGQFAKQGALLSEYYAEAHPSLPNYIALTAGTTAGLTSNAPVSLGLRHIGDLLEAKDKLWKVYAEGYPGRCFLGERSGLYVRKHVPFLSFENVQKRASRCARIVEASALISDVASGKVPDYSMYIPDEQNDGHDTGPAFADRWLAKSFGSLLKNSAFMKGLLFVVTFDEADGSDPRNRVFTALKGDSVLSGSVSKKPYNHYSLLRTIEDGLGLGNLGQNDASAFSMVGVWK